MNTSWMSATWVGALAAAGVVLGSQSARAQSCEADADCPEHMSCVAQTTWECDGGFPGGAGGAAGTSAGGSGGEAGMGSAGEPSCQEVPAESICIPRYQLPCESASDCGGGFDCVETYYWQCGGGGVGGMPAGAGGAGGDVGETGGAGGEPSCEEVPSGEHVCVLQDLACASTSDCPSPLECLEQYSYPPCDAGGSGGSGGSGGTAAGGFGGSAGMPVDCPDPIVQLRCVPPNGGTGGVGGGMGGVGGDPSGSGGSGGIGSGGSGGSGGDSGSAGSGPGAGAGGETDEDPGNDEDHGHHGKGRGRGLIKRLLQGCTAGGPVSGGGSTAWLMLGLAALVLHRRARRS